MAKLNSFRDKLLSLVELAAQQEPPVVPDHQSRFYLSRAQPPILAQTDVIDLLIVPEPLVEPLSVRACLLVITGLAGLCWAIIVMLVWSVLFI